MTKKILGKNFLNLFLILYVTTSCVTVLLFLANRGLSFYADIFSILTLFVILLRTGNLAKRAKQEFKTLTILIYFIAFTALHLYFTNNFIAIKVGFFCCTYLICRLILKYLNYNIIKLLIRKIVAIWIIFGCVELIIRLIDPAALPNIFDHSNQIVTRGPISIQSDWRKYALCSLGLSQGSFACILISSWFIFYKSKFLKYTSVFLWIFCGTLTSLISFIVAQAIHNKKITILILVTTSILILFYSDICKVSLYIQNTNFSRFCNLYNNLNGTYAYELLLWPTQEYVQYKPFLISVFGNLPLKDNFVPKFGENKIFNIVFQTPLFLIILFCTKALKGISFLRKQECSLFLIFVFFLIALNKCGFYYTAPGSILLAIILNIPSLKNTKAKGL